MADQLNIIIANHQPGITTLVKKTCDSISGIGLISVAHSKQMLIAKANHKNPDLIFLTLDSAMGGIDVIDTIKTIAHQVNLIVLYEQKRHDPNQLVCALELGAYECIELPDHIGSSTYNEFRLRLLTIIGLLNSRKRFSSNLDHPYKSKFFQPAKESPKEDQTKEPAKGKIALVAIASSTGGPEILSRIFSILPGNLKVPVLLVQHIPEKITRFFVKSLNRKSELDITQAHHGDIIQPARVYVAPGGKHMAVSKPDEKGQRKIVLSKSAPINSVRPSADILFDSIAHSYSGNVLAVVLTGMGEDGKNGIKNMKGKGCFCITQKAETCVVYGMPKAVDNAGLSDESLDPLSITQKIVTLVQ